MKTYNRPNTQITELVASYMLMNNVSGGDIKGVNEGDLDHTIEIF